MSARGFKQRCAKTIDVHGTHTHTHTHDRDRQWAVLSGEVSNVFFLEFHDSSERAASECHCSRTEPLVQKSSFVLVNE